MDVTVIIYYSSQSKQNSFKIIDVIIQWFNKYKLSQTFMKIGAILFYISWRQTNRQTQVKTQPPGGGNIVKNIIT